MERVLNPNSCITIVFFGDQWDDFWRRRQQIASRLVQYDSIEKLVYIELPLTLATIIQYKQKKVSTVVATQCHRVLRCGTWVRPTDNLAILTPILPVPRILSGKPLRQVNTVLCRLQVRVLLRRFLGSLDAQDRVVWVSLPHLESFYGQSPFSLFDCGIRCYDLSEDHTARPLFSSTKTVQELQQIREWDRQLTRQADRVFVNSQALLQTRKMLNKNTYLALNGVDMKLFERNQPAGELPAELERIVDGPILGFVGGIFDEEVDIELLQYISLHRPMWHIVLIGPTNAQTSSQLEHLQNVHLLGPKPYQELGRYLVHCDVCLALYKAVDGNRVQTSLKLLNYLAMGKPVVSTNAGGACEFAEVISIANSYQEFLEMIDRALNHDEPAWVERRVTAAKEHSWERRVQQIYDCLLGCRAECTGT